MIIFSYQNYFLKLTINKIIIDCKQKSYKHYIFKDKFLKLTLKKLNFAAKIDTCKGTIKQEQLYSCTSVFQ